MATWRQLRRAIAKAQGTLEYNNKYKKRHGNAEGVNRRKSASSYIGSHGMQHG
ncbi:hypothetical protein [uncultured Mediterranean phage uvMED]|nr:hypothetical protein [uncultured Mediterranean phage uvMED]